jgi:hypothetical protein
MKTLNLDHFLKEEKRKQKAREKGLICFLCNNPMKVVRNTCSCKCFDNHPYLLKDMKDMIKIAKIKGYGIYRKELKKEMKKIEDKKNIK